jgi:hypothetical protein
MGVGRLSPLTLEDVYQVIDTSSNSVKNVVYATLSPPMFVETWGRFPIAAVANGARTLHGKATFRVDFSLDHSFEISSMEFPAQVSFDAFPFYRKHCSFTTVLQDCSPGLVLLLMQPVLLPFCELSVSSSARLMPCTCALFVVV